MNRTTLYAMVAFVALLAAVLVMRYAPAGGETVPPVTIAGWAADEAPFDQITIVRGGERLVLVKSGNGEDAQWAFTEPRAAAADTFKVKQIFGKLTAPIESSLSKKLGPADLRAFQLDAKNRIGLTLQAKGEVLVDFVVGGLEKEAADPAVAAPASPDTWVMKPGEEDCAYRLPGVDLRTAIDKGFDELRSKKVFTAKADDITQVHITSALDLLHPTIALVRDEPAEEGGEPTWRFDVPKGYAAGDIKAYVNTILSAYANAYLPADDAEGKAALEASPYGVTLTPKEGEPIEITVSEPDDKQGYLRVAGRDEIVKISKYTAERMRKSLGDLRRKALFSAKPGEVTRFVLTNANGTFAFDKTDGVWSGSTRSDDAAILTFLRDATGLKLSAYVGQLPPAETGLDKPSRSLVLTAGDKVATLLLGAEKDGKVYGTLVGKGEVFTLTSWAAKKLDKKAADFVTKPKPAAPPKPE